MKPLTYIILLFGIFIFPQNSPAPQQSQPIAITNITLHTGLGNSIEKATVLFDKGRFIYVGNELPKFPENTLIIEGNNQHLYPGFIAPNTALGLVEIDAVRATRDYSETGTFNPNVNSLVAYNAESKILETVKPNGVLLAQITPEGNNSFSGTSSIVQLDAWNWQDAVVKKNDGIHLYWPKSYTNLSSENYEKNMKTYREKVLEIENDLIAAKAYTGTPLNLKLAQLQKIYTDNIPLYVHVDKAYDIQRVIALKDQFNILKMVIVGGAEALELSDEFITRSLPILVHRVHSLPEQDDDDINYFYELPLLLHKKGIMVGLQNNGNMAEMNVRNLAFYAGTLVAYGMEKETALQLITLNNARILGIDSEYGSIEVGKSATFFLSEGDALDMRTQNISQAFIEGRNIDLHSFQKDLYEKYRLRNVGK